MNADGIRLLFGYHFEMNRRVWDRGIARLTEAQFVQGLEYSVGSIRNQVVHLASVDMRWIARLAGGPVPASLEPTDYPDRPAVRARWDAIEADMRHYLEALTDAALTRDARYDTASRGPRTSPTWQVLVHVVNHGTDHRAQTLAMLHGLGAPTLGQDLMGWLWDRGGGAEVARY